MKRNLKIANALLFALALLPTTQLQAQSDNELKRKFNPVSTAIISQTIAPDARAAGMGDIGAATEPDAASQAWNPAKYPFAISRAGLSVNYTPWLRQIVNDIDLAYLSGYVRLGDYQAISGSVRYFSLGKVDMSGVTVKPYEFAVDLAYSRMLSEKFSAAVALRYLYSDLNSGFNETTGGSAFAADISAYYTNYLTMGQRECQLAFGVNISNIGSKVNYGTEESYFLPTNLRLGVAYTIPMNEYNRITFTAEANKLLVPTPPIQGDTESPEDYRQRLQTEYMDQSPISGIFKSFGDAPGGFKEELEEVQWNLGAEYVYNDKFSLRGGYHHESVNKGNRKYFTVGAGFKMNVFQVDAGYVIATTSSNPLDQTLRVSLSFDMDGLRDLFSRR